MKKWKVIGLITMSIITLAACSSNKSNTTTSSSKKGTQEIEVPVETSSQETRDSNEGNENILEKYNKLAASSKSTKEIYVTDDIEVGKDGTVKPGIFDLEVTGGSGNIMGTRSTSDSLSINWVASAKGSDTGYASKIRIILFEGDILNFSNISKIKFTAVPEKVNASNQLGNGEYIVGRDIKAGQYKLSTNMKMDDKYGNLGWSIEIYDEASQKNKSQSYNPDNKDVAVSLKDGEVITTSFDNTDYSTSGDKAKLIFTKIN